MDDLKAVVERLERDLSEYAEHGHMVPLPSDLRTLLDALRESREALEKIADESVFNQQRFAEDTDTDYFLRCFGAVKTRARAALAGSPET